MQPVGWLERHKRRRRPRTGGGISTPLGGFTRPQGGDSEQEIVRRLVMEVAGKRVLTEILFDEFEGEVNRSVLRFRDLLTDYLKLLRRRKTPAYHLLTHLREQCNRYLSVARDPIDQPFTRLRPHFEQALRELRESFRVALLSLAVEYDLREAQELARRIEDGTHW